MSSSTDRSGRTDNGTMERGAFLSRFISLVEPLDLYEKYTLYCLELCKKRVLCMRVCVRVSTTRRRSRRDASTIRGPIPSFLLSLLVVFDKNARHVETHATRLIHFFFFPSRGVWTLRLSSRVCLCTPPSRQWAGTRRLKRGGPKQSRSSTYVVAVFGTYARYAGVRALRRIASHRTRLYRRHRNVGSPLVGTSVHVHTTYIRSYELLIR